MSADATIREILKRYDEAPGEGVTWKVQSATVITHKALERIAVKAQIRFPAPTVIRAERDEAVILVTGTMQPPAGQAGEAETAWSIGEALVNVNYRVSGKQAAYVYAMAEKRAKDRVILKLIGLHGLLYSEEEADEFKAQQRETAADDDVDQRTTSERMRDAMVEDLQRRAGADAIDRFMNHATIRRDLAVMDADDVKVVQAAADARRSVEPARAA